MPHSPLSAPLYQRIYGVLYRRIQRGVYAPGAALESEDELVAEFAVSKATIRQAVGILVERGLVERRQGRGTFVREDAAVHRPHAFVGSFTELIIGTDDMSFREFSVEHDVPFPVNVREALGMQSSSGTALVYRRDLRGEPFAYTVVYLSPAVVELLEPEEIVPFERAHFEMKRGMPITGATQSMSAEIADSLVATNLSIEIGQPVLFSERVVRSELRPVEFIHTWYRGDMFKWQADLSFAWSGTNLTVTVSVDEPSIPAK